MLPSSHAPRYSPGVTAALVLALCFLLALVARGMVESFTTFLLPLGREFGWNRTSLNSVYALYALTAGVAAPSVGWMLDAWGPKRLYVLGVCLLASGFVGASLASQLWHLQLCVGVIVGFAYVMLSALPHTVVLSRWYPHRVSSAVGVVQASNGLGIFILVPVAQLLIETVGWRLAYLWLGAIVAGLLVPLAFARRTTLERGRRARRPPELEVEPNGTDLNPGPSDRHWTLRKALGNVSFWCLFWIFFFTSVGNFAVVPQMVPLLASTGISAFKAASVFGVIGTFAMAGLVGYGWLSDRIGVFPAATMSYLGSVGGFAALIVLLYAPTEALLWAFAFLFGPSMGSRYPMVSAYAAELFRGPQLGRIFGVIGLSQGTGTALGSFAGGLIHDLTGGYGCVVAFGLVAIALAYAPFVLIRIRGLR